MVFLVPFLEEHASISYISANYLSFFVDSRMPIIDKFKDMGTMVMGKIESGTIREGNSLLVMPNKVVIKHFSLAHQKK